VRPSEEALTVERVDELVGSEAELGVGLAVIGLLASLKALCDNAAVEDGWCPSWLTSGPIMIRTPAPASSATATTPDHRGAAVSTCGAACRGTVRACVVLPVLAALLVARRAQCRTVLIKAAACCRTTFDECCSTSSSGNERLVVTVRVVSAVETGSPRHPITPTASTLSVAPSRTRSVGASSAK